MMLQTAPVFPITSAICILFIFLVPLAAAGIALMNTGLGRSRSAAHSMMASLAVFGVAAVIFFFCGFAFEGFAGAPGHVLKIAGNDWGWLGAQPFFLRGIKYDGSASSLVALLQMLSVGLVAMIPLGSGGDRWRLGAACASSALLAGITYPIFAHWVWGGGWLAQLGVNYGIGRGFVDAGGSGTIQVVGGLTALSIAWILGPRRGKYALDGMPAAIPGHNAVLVLFGCLLSLLGWFGLNSAGAILFANADPNRCALIAINTTLCATAATLATAFVTRFRFGKPDASLCANGWVGGLVASSAAAPFLAPAAAVLIGIVAGALVAISVEWFEVRFQVDDPGGAVSVHAVCGIWGLLALGICARMPDQPLNGATGNGSQWLAQVVGVATLFGFVLPITYGLNWLLNRFYRQRVALEGERQGLDLHELGAGAYPEFLTHTDDFLNR